MARLRLVWTRLALADLDSAREHLREQAPQRARRLIERMDAALERLAAHPLTGRPGRIAGTRELVLTRNPYIIAYRIVDDAIELLAVIHTSRRWPDRL